jgi:hypothetical protein
MKWNTYGFDRFTNSRKICKILWGFVLFSAVIANLPSVGSAISENWLNITSRPNT